MGQNRHKVKKAEIKRKAKVTAPGNKRTRTNTAAPARGDSSARLSLSLASRGRWPHSREPRGRSGVGGACAGQRAVLSDSSSESLFSVTECRRACSRGLRRSGGPSSTWMEGMSKWTRSARRRREGRLRGRRGHPAHRRGCSAPSRGGSRRSPAQPPAAPRARPQAPFSPFSEGRLLSGRGSGTSGRGDRPPVGPGGGPSCRH